jgi:hypothetical protein
LLDETVQGYQRALQITRNRLDAGIAPRTDLLQAQTQLANAQADRAALVQQRAQLEHAIAVLVGETPSSFTLTPAPWQPTVPAVPVGVPSELLQRRPDIAAAERRMAAANADIGIARAAYQATLEYVKERKAFGAPIGTFQMTQAKIADMKCKLDGALLLTLRAAWVKGQGQRFSNEAAIAKLTASEAAMWITHQAVQIHGGMGYSKEMPLERYFRDAKITEIYEGTSEIQRLVIARNETGLR